MENRNIVIIVVALLLAAVAVGLVIRGTSTPEVPEPEPIADVGKAGAPEEAPKPVKAKRAPPEGPAQPASLETTASGLQYADLAVGTGESPVLGSVVTVEYTGWLRDGGKMFDSSFKRPDPFKFVIGKGGVIPGWDEGVMTMKEGGKRQLVIPGDLAYGQRGSPPNIPPNATLVFDIELLEVAPPRIGPDAPPKVDAAAMATTASGLKTHDITTGTGKRPQMGDTVVVEYTGWLENGKKFDSSYNSTDPVEFRLGRVIKGWNEGLASMQVGGKRLLVIPPDLAYGAKSIPPGAPPEEALIPPNSTLIFEVELLAVK